MPDWKAYLRDRLDTASLPPEHAEDILEELAQHLAERYDEAVNRGATDAQALAIASADLPHSSDLQAAMPRSPRRAPPVSPPHDGGRPMAALIQDAHYAVRILARTPAVTLVAIATLALGIGGTTAMFSVVNAVLLRPLPYAEPDRLVHVGHHADGRASRVGYATYLDWRDRSDTFEKMAAIGSWSPTLATGSGPERLHGMRVTHGFFEMLGVRPALGRLFSEEDDRPGVARRAALLSHRLWKRRFGGSPDVVGRAVRINDLDYRIVGVLPSEFEPLVSGHFYQAAEIWSPLGYAPSLPYACRSCQHLLVVGRLRAGVAPDVARAELETIQQDLVDRYPNEYAEAATAVVALSDEMVRDVRPTLRVLMSAIVLLLCIAVANIASLLLARAAARHREMALRSVLGAGPGRIVRQLLTEGLILGVLGGAAGIAVAFWATPLLVSLAPVELPRLDEVRIDRAALALAAAITLACGLLVGLAPALRLSRPDLVSPMKAGDRTVRGGARRARSALVAAQVALAVVLLAGAGLMVRTMTELLRVSPGFDADGVLTVRVSAVGSQLAETAQRLVFQREILAQIQALPSVDSVALASQIPFGGNVDRYGVTIESRPELGPEERPDLERYAVTPAYFETLRIPLRLGRLLNERDMPDSEPVVLVNETAARRIWPGGDVLGQRVRLGGNDAPFRTIVGVVGDVRHNDLSAAAPMQIYLPQTQMTDAYLTVLVRASVDPETIVPAIRRALSTVAPSVPAYDVALLRELVGRSVAERRFLMRLLAALAGLALLLAGMGVYGILAWWVAQRLPEIAVRIALGACPSQIVRLVLFRGTAIVAAGAAAGLASALALTTYLESQLYGVSARDPLTFTAILIVVIGAALLANLLPARRAARVDPLLLLRAE